MIAAPSTASTIPVARFRVTALALLAKRAAIRAHRSVDNTQKIRHHRSGIPPMAKWIAAPVNAVNAMINTLAGHRLDKSLAGIYGCHSFLGCHDRFDDEFDAKSRADPGDKAYDEFGQHSYDSSDPFKFELLYVKSSYLSSD